MSSADPEADGTLARHAPMNALVAALGRSEPSPHDGRGDVLLLRAYEHADRGPRVDLIHLVVVPPGSTLGRHRHGDDVEWYLVVGGTGTMHVDGREIRVRRGDVVINRPFGEHGLANDSAGELCVVVFKISPGSPDR